MEFQRMRKKTGFGILSSALVLVTAEKVQIPNFVQRRKADEGNE